MRRPVARRSYRRGAVLLLFITLLLFPLAFLLAVNHSRFLVPAPSNALAAPPPQPPQPPALPLPPDRPAPVASLVAETVPPSPAAVAAAAATAVAATPLLAPSEAVTVVLVFCYNRAQYLQRTLDSLASRASRSFLNGELHVVVSQDGDNAEVAEVAARFVSNAATRGLHAEHVRHARDARQAQLRGGQAAYYLLAQHYGWALGMAFDRPSTRRVIILEDDLELAVDFFAYFEAFAPLLDDAEENLLAVSAWNDHGQPRFVGDPAAFVRADFFPGLGWMMPRRVWDGQLKQIWPDSYWDDWLREPERRRGRQTIRPQVSRAVTFGRDGGASAGQFFSQYLAPMVLNAKPVDFSRVDVDALRKRRWDVEFLAAVRGARLSTPDAMRLNGGHERVEYRGEEGYRRVCAQLGMMDDIKAGVPRGSYKGVVPLFIAGTNVYVAPDGV